MVQNIDRAFAVIQDLPNFVTKDPESKTMKVAELFRFLSRRIGYGLAFFDFVLNSNSRTLCD